MLPPETVHPNGEDIDFRPVVYSGEPEQINNKNCNFYLLKKKQKKTMLLLCLWGFPNPK